MADKHTHNGLDSEKISSSNVTYNSLNDNYIKSNRTEGAIKDLDKTLLNKINKIEGKTGDLPVINSDGNIIDSGFGLDRFSKKEHEHLDKLSKPKNYDFNSYKEVINSYSSKHWYPGFKVAIGYIANLNDYLYANFELKYQSFFNFDSRPSPLVMIRSSNLGYLALSTKVFFSF